MKTRKPRAAKATGSKKAETADSPPPEGKRRKAKAKKDEASGSRSKKAPKKKTKETEEKDLEETPEEKALREKKAKYSRQVCSLPQGQKVGFAGWQHTRRSSGEGKSRTCGCTRYICHICLHIFRCALM